MQVWQRQAQSPLMQVLVWQQESKQQGIKRKHHSQGHTAVWLTKKCQILAEMWLCAASQVEQREHYPPAASGLNFSHWDVASWDCCFFFCIRRHLSHCYYVHQVVLEAVRVSELNPCSHEPSESQKASSSLWLSGISKLCGHQELQYIAEIFFLYVPWKVLLPKDVD